MLLAEIPSGSGAECVEQDYIKLFMAQLEAKNVLEEEMKKEAETMGMTKMDKPGQTTLSNWKLIRMRNINDSSYCF